MSAEAREAVARALMNLALCENDCDMDEEVKNWHPDADAALAALKPIIAAEIREYAKQADEAWQDIESYSTDADAVRAELDDLATSADEIASRICGSADE